MLIKQSKTKMEKIKDFQNQELSDIEMDNIQGGLSWSKWEQISSDGVPGFTIEQRFNWFGLHGTTETRQDCN